MSFLVREKLRVALAVVTGRTPPECLSHNELAALGYDPHRMPPADCILHEAEALLLDVLEHAERMGRD